MTKSKSTSTSKSDSDEIRPMEISRPTRRPHLFPGRFTVSFDEIEADADEAGHSTLTYNSRP
jgi:hypothetical protein